MREFIKAHLAVFCANLLFGLNYIVTKEIIPYPVDPLALTLFRIVGATVLFWLLFPAKKYGRVGREDITRLFLAGFCGVAVNQFLFLQGMTLTAPIDASIIMTTNPVIVLVISIFLLNERVTWIKLAGILLAGAGALLIILHVQGGGQSSGNLWGNLMILGNSTAYAFFLVITKPMMQKYHPVVVMKWVFLFGLMLVTPFTLQPALSVDLSLYTGYTPWFIAFLVLGPTFAAYLMIQYAMRILRPTGVSIYINTQPLITSLVSVMLARDVITWLKIYAGLMVVSGVFLVASQSDWLKNKRENRRLSKNTHV
jgi:drug/metabolite transporter (DMT)-like permease